MLKVCLVLSIAGTIFGLGSGALLVFSQLNEYSFGPPVRTDPTALWHIFQYSVFSVLIAIAFFILAHKKGDRHPFQ